MTSREYNNKIYQVINILSKNKKYPVATLCEIAEIRRSAYYKWLNKEITELELENQKLMAFIKDAYDERGGILGYRQMTHKIRREYNRCINYKRVYRLMKLLGLKSVCRRKKYNYIKSTPQITADNILNRQFNADNICKKWLTYVTELKYGEGKKAYLSAILDLGDRSIVSYVIGHSNNNPLVFETFDLAIASNPEAHPIFHSDRGFQYTSRGFKAKLDKAGMTQSMSRVSRCIDNGPMEGFWGILKSEMYNLTKFKDYNSLKVAIDDYINYYNNKRYQKRLKCMTPLEYRNFISLPA